MLDKWAKSAAEWRNKKLMKVYSKIERWLWQKQQRSIRDHYLEVRARHTDFWRGKHLLVFARIPAIIYSNNANNINNLKTETATTTVSRSKQQPTAEKRWRNPGYRGDSQNAQPCSKSRQHVEPSKLHFQVLPVPTRDGDDMERAIANNGVKKILDIESKNGW